MHSINIIAKVVRKCNLKCSYCNELDMNSNIMPFRVVSNIIFKTLTYPNMSSVKFVWHGGEPLLRGIDFYKKILYLQNKCKKKDQEVKNVIQTNGTLLNDTWASFLRQGRFGLGISLDGPRELHDLQRHYPNGNGTFDEVLEGINSLNKYRINFGVLMVVTENTLRYDPKKLFDFFINNNIKDFSFLHQRPRTDPNAIYDFNNDYVNLLKFNVFLKKMFDIWYNHDDPSIHIREFENIIELVLGGKPRICFLTGKCFGKFLGVNLNGDVFHCDRFMSDNTYKFGNINYHEFEYLIDNIKIEKLYANQKGFNYDCERCEFFDICRGGCPHDKYINIRSKSNLENICGNKLLIEHISEKIKKSMVSIS